MKFSGDLLAAAQLDSPIVYRMNRPGPADASGRGQDGLRCRDEPRSLPVPANTKPTAGAGDIRAQWLLREGRYIRDLRSAAGMTQATLAALAGFGGKQLVSCIETGRCHVPPERVQTLAKALDADFHAFAVQLLRYQNPWLYAGVIGADRRLRAELRLAARG